MKRRRVETSLGTVDLHGRSTGRPVLFVLAGLYSSPGFGTGMQDWWPNVDVVVGRVPGDGAPALAQPSVGMFAAAYSEALSILYPERPVFAFGISAGALIALALRTELRGLLLVEPPLRSCSLWPLRDALRDVGPSGWESLAAPLFGITRTEHASRDYRPLLRTLSVPTKVLVGDMPLLPRRPLPVQPSLVDDESRDALRQASVSIIEVSGAGHGVLNAAPDIVEFHLRQSIASAGLDE